MLFRIWLENTVISWKAHYKFRKNLLRWNWVEQGWLRLSSWVHLFIKCWLTDAWPPGTSWVPPGCLVGWTRLSSLDPPQLLFLPLLFLLVGCPPRGYWDVAKKMENTNNDNKIDSVQTETSDKRKAQSKKALLQLNV